ncbi:MAG TPA: alanine--tRNA ligase [Salinivirgaceae bacterium]|nr:alanine--tRNA ligase [Salinivirgaceae bacterium]
MQTPMNANQIRQTFKDFFASKQHKIVDSAPMVVKNDPTLMFTNAGMNQFKDLFLGQSEIKYPRIANSQKCLRVSGKHNDLEEVGHDTYHHTMFEMLGNWSFGDYFKEEAIDWAWELLTEVYKIDKDRLYVTVFEGDAHENLERDEESAKIWAKHVSPDRILLGNKKDNFWEMGATGPCGPCSEIHVDLRSDEERSKIPGQYLVNKGHHLVIEIWNLVFMQFNRRDDGSLVPLPAKHVDTGMGFERLCMVLQGKQSNYDTDVFTPIIRRIEELSGIKYGLDAQKDVAFRVIADHLRAVSFAIADGQLPSNNKAGYVIRRILRRAIRYAFTFLDQNEPFICKLVSTLAREMGNAYPELIRQQDIIEKVIREEESTFLRTLAAGIRMIEAQIEILKKSEKNTFDGKVAFELYDTYGFPLDLTELILNEHHLQLDHQSFEESMKQQKERSRKASMIVTNDWVEIRKPETIFVGYETTECDANIVAFRKATVKGKEVTQIVLDQTPFYAESGGQVGDSGWLINDSETIQVLDTVKENNLIVHTISRLPQNIEVPFVAKVDEQKRKNTENNHSATHLLHFALRQILGNHVEQKGSLVDSDRLRFDFSHFQRVTEEEIFCIEDLVNQFIRQNIKLTEYRDVPMEKAMELNAMMLFGEKYGEKVRVIQFDQSVELCGGTHVQFTGQIGFFTIVSESAIAAGIRRIEAVTAQKAIDFVRGQITELDEVRQLLKGPKSVVKAIEGLLAENHTLQKQLEVMEHQKTLVLKNQLTAKIRQHNGIRILAEIIEVSSPNSLKDICFQLKNETPDLFCVLASEIDGKASLAVAIHDNLVKTKGYHAGNIVREVACEIDGGGGGQPFFATAGGKNPKGLSKAIEKILNKL